MREMFLSIFHKNKLSNSFCSDVEGMVRGIIVTFLFLLAAFSAWTTPAFASSATLSKVVIEASGQDHVFTVEVAEKPSERAQGLMYREKMDEDRGMLFIFDDEDIVVMWMKNTFISLDMLFVDSSGRIVHIAPSTTPLSLSRIPSVYPVRGVLEINGGLSEKLGIHEGDILRHSAFVAAEQPEN